VSRLWLGGRAEEELATPGRVEKELAVCEVAEGVGALVGLLFFPSFFSNLPSVSSSSLFTPSSTREPVHKVLIVEAALLMI